MSDAERRRRYRAQCKARGICIICRQPLDRDGAYCVKCCAEHTEESRWYRAMAKQA